MKWALRKSEPERDKWQLQNLRTSPEVRASLHAEGITFLHIGTGTVLSANRVGARMWERASEGLALDAIAAQVSLEFDAPQATVRQDADRFLRELMDAGVLVRQGESLAVLA